MFDAEEGFWVLGSGFWPGKEVEAARAARAARANTQNPKPRTSLLDALDAHIERRWLALSDQSRRRLGCLAASVGTSVTPEAHAELVGALAMIADAEGVLEAEQDFAEDYLGTEWVCEAVAEYERDRATAQSSERREQVRLAVRKHRLKKRGKVSRRASKKAERAAEKRAETFAARAIAIDGEGVTLDDGSGRHLYRYLAASDSAGNVLGELESDDGITSEDALDFVAGLPKVDEDGSPYLGIFGYGLGYDLAKMLEGLKNKKLYELFHDGDDQKKVVFKRFRLNLIGKCFQMDDRKAPQGARRTLVWDILKGFQSTFVRALKDWSVGTPEEWQRIEDMKKQRGNFVHVSWDAVKQYCQDECRLLGVLVETYIRAHLEAGIDLRGRYHGAGSTSDAFLELMGAREKKCTRKLKDEDALGHRDSMRTALLRSFFGGRAEISRLGVVRGPVYSADIASAYPHALFVLPCVRHGRWKRVSQRGLGRALPTAKLACVHFTLAFDSKWWRPGFVEPGPGVDQHERRRRKELEGLSEVEKFTAERAQIMDIDERSGTTALPWGPLPYRTKKGSTFSPAQHPGGWAWMPEYEAAKKHFGDSLNAIEAWVLSGKCQCERPYQDIGMYYCRRLEWAKQGGANRGKVLKLGMNGCYGKTAQTIGKNPKYACRAVAGQITGTTRGRMVEAIYSQDDPWSVFYAATDGLISDRPMAPPNPPDNSTSSEAKRLGKSPLGMWEVEKHDDSLFVVQPGFYFSLARKGKARTRGTPLEIIDEYRDQILAQWAERPTQKPRGLPKQSVFHGVKRSILKPTKAQGGYRRKKVYGRWTTEERKIGYVVNPKRGDLSPLGDGSYRLYGWFLPVTSPESAEYRKDPAFKEADDQKDDQPDYVEPLVRGVGEAD